MLLEMSIGMLELAFALFAFVTLHLLPSVAGIRGRVVARIGTSSYTILYSTLSLISLAWLVIATMRAPAELLWMPAGWQAWITVVTSPVALVFVLAGLFSNNPLSLSFFGRSDRPVGAVVSICRHPVYLGALIWAIGHIPPNGQIRSVMLFGGLAALALAGFWLGDRRAQRRLGEDWAHIASATSRLPFVTIASGRASLRLDWPLVLGALTALAVSVWLVHGGHAALFGVDPIAATRY